MKIFHYVRRYAAAAAASLGLAGMLVVCTDGEASAAESFRDLQSVRWAEDGIYYLADRGTVAGYGGGQFRPAQSITRAQAVTYLVRELYGDEQFPRGAGFTDVPDHHMFYREIMIASGTGLAGGLPDGTFRPDAPITRGETAALLTRAYALAEGRTASQLQDIAGHWAEEDILRLASNSLAGGYPDGTFRPSRQVSRAEYAVFLSRVIRHQRSAAIRSADWSAMLKLMTLQEKAGQMLMPDIRMWQGSATLRAHDGTAATIRDHRLGGMILFDKNIASIQQIVTLSDGLQRQAGDIPLLLGIDQEGGVIKRIPGGINLPGAMALGATGDELKSRSAGQLTGEQLEALGIRLNFAPVLDVNSNPANPIIGIRSFGSEPELVGRLGLAFMNGLQESGVIAAVKHFPGHGDTAVDSHLGLPVVPHTRARLEQVELAPFRAAVQAGADMILTAHVAYPALDNTRVSSRKDGSAVYLPATLSPRMIGGLLRGELGYDGVVVSDAFTMKALADHFGEHDAVVRAVDAGVDIILMPEDITGAYEAIIQAVRSGHLQEQQLDQAVSRILSLKHRYGLFEPQPPVEQRLLRAVQAAGSTTHRDTERRIAEAAVTRVIQLSAAQPLQAAEGSVIAVVAPDEIRAALVRQALSGIGLPQHEVKTLIAGGVDRAAIRRFLEDADTVIVASYQFRNLPEQYDWASYQRWIDELNEQSLPYVFLSMGNPYEWQHLLDIREMLAVYAAEPPNIAAGLRAAFGQFEPSGKLPVAAQ
ncbi:glycoside hydrolase family 3 N-terminal domain-containing protein [Paenibacillus sp. 1P07SE]|uniref:glycoside hydrolase family 3 N-terminal domain-containing protein n=1 Tax=Paenibacillus sp. 1P07SE TaxID=3132209 RepID=UPI0039A687B8